MRSRPASFGGFVWLMLLACSTATGRTATTTNAAQCVRDPRLSEIVSEFPGFGGRWLDKDGNLNVSVTPLSDSTRLKVALAGELTRLTRGATTNPKFIFHRARFRLTDLEQWKSQIARVAIDSVPGFQSSGVRHSNNQVQFGVTDPLGIPALRRLAASLKIPAAAVQVELEGPICTLEARPGIVISVKDSVTEKSLIRGSRLFAREDAFVDSASVPDDPRFRPDAFPLARERAGVYEVGVDKPGYTPWRKAGVRVDKDACHVTTIFLTALLVKM